jgi:hypothetical protein
MSTDTGSPLARLRPHPDVIVAGVALVSVELLAVVVYLLVVPNVYPTRPLFYAIPFVWINAALWGVWRVRSPAAPRRRRLVAGALAAAYLAVLAYVGGLVGAGVGDLATGLRVEVVSLPPGWGPAVIYAGEDVVVRLLAFKTLGYLALAYLVYAAVLDAAGGAAAGLLGLFSCVSCTLPVIAAVLSSTVGGAGALAALALGQSYPLSTAVFVVTVGLLVWRPTAGTFSRWRPSVGT